MGVRNDVAFAGRVKTCAQSLTVRRNHAIIGVLETFQYALSCPAAGSSHEDGWKRFHFFEVRDWGQMDLVDGGAEELEGKVDQLPFSGWRSGVTRLISGGRER